MFRRIVWGIVLLLPAAVPANPCAPASTAAPAAAALEAMAARAGVIFAGSVTRVERHDADGYVDVTFAVEHAVRGIVHAGNHRPVYVLREWSGLWGGGDRYLVGQRLLMVLSGRGPSGMSAPIDGMAGIIPLVATRLPPIWRQGQVTADPGAADDGDETVDLRWVETRAVRSPAALEGHAPGATRGPSLAAVLVLLAEAGAP